MVTSPVLEMGRIRIPLLIPSARGEGIEDEQEELGPKWRMQEAK